MKSTVTRFKLLFFALLLTLAFALPAQAADSKKALMLTVFGTSTEATVTFAELLPLVQQRFPDRDVVIPYTSKIIREKLNAEIFDPAKRILSPDEMLEKLAGQGYSDIAVVTTVLFAGVEHDKIQASVDKFRAGHKNIKLTYVPPLFSDHRNLQPAVNALRKQILPEGINVVVAHGTHEGHSVEKSYLELARVVQKTYPNALVGSIEGVPDMEEVLKKVENSKAREVRFIVFMFVAGDHAENDIAGDEEDSLFTAVREMGKNPSVAMLKTSIGFRIASLGLLPEYRELLLNHYAKGLGE